MTRAWRRVAVARASSLALLVAAAGCGGANPPRPVTGVRSGETTSRDRPDPLAARFVDLGRQLAPAGVRPVALGGRGFLAARASETVAVEVPARTCVSIVALTSAGLRDLDATLFDPSGDVLAEDVEPDPHPTIQVCAGPSPRRLYYSLVAYDGAGAYRWAAFAGERSTFEAVTRTLGGRPGVVADTPAETEQDLRVRDFATGVGRRGFRGEGEALRVPLATAQRVRVPLEVRASTCYTIAAFTLAGLGDLDLRVLDEEGEEVARDVSPAADPAAQTCVDRDALWSIELHAARGAGQARLFVYRAAVAAIGGSSGLWLGQRAEVRVASVPLDEALARDLAQARQAGWSGAAARGRGELVPGEAVAHRVDVAAGRCTLVLATGGAGLGRLSLRVVDEATGELLAERNARGPSASARVCSPTRRRASAQLVARLGHGTYAVHVATRARPSDLPDGATAGESGALLDAIEDAAALGWPRRGPGFEAIALGAETPGTLEIPLAAEECVRIAVVAGGEGDARVGAVLLRGGRPLGRASGRAVDLRACGAAGSERATLEVRSAGGATRAWVAVFARPAPPGAP